MLATDGDFNVGVSSRGGLEELIEDKRDSGVFLTVLGFGMGNLKDATMELLADKGNGNYAYIDSHQEAEKVLVREVGATLVTIAKDVKIQVEFNPAKVAAYRLVGYENRMLAAEDFNDDRKDAGELGAGHTVTALYEVVPVGVDFDTSTVDALKYQEARDSSPLAGGDELLTVKLRYKELDAGKSTRLELALNDDLQGVDNDNVKFSAAVAAFGMLLRDSEHKGDASFDMVVELARASRGRRSARRPSGVPQTGGNGEKLDVASAVPLPQRGRGRPPSLSFRGRVRGRFKNTRYPHLSSPQKGRGTC